MLRNIGLVFRGFEVKFSTNASRVSVPHEDIATKVLKVAVIGVPNVGKSTFINNLMDRKVCPASSKVHTTRAKSQAIFTEGDSQIVFLDTPGLVSFQEYKKFSLEKSFLKDSKSSLREADIIGVIHDASNIWTREKLDIKVIRLLEDNKTKPSFLVLNKVDIIKSKRKLLDVTRQLTENCIEGAPIPGGKPLRDKETRGWPHFSDVFMVSALTGSGLDEVKNYLIRNAKPGEWPYPGEIWSDKTAEEIIVDSVKAKLLDFLPQEIPYTLKPEMEFFNINDKGVISAVVLVHCPSKRIAQLVAGESEGKLRQINESLQVDLQRTFHNYVRIKVVLSDK
ncbi:GTPase Era, mitochondrial-like Protein [Tribolium castaneum]|uniref:GTPase Era, mitochondrial n=2 Tax=Tribolium castaneum TaxID=7070 RepID=D6WW14_TRICA|nr:GTPase Era, mitochondrial-like Protein [Tribolium castaneum]